VEDAAQTTIEAILQNETLATIPTHYKNICNFVNVLPLSVQQIWRDRVLKEFDFKNPSKRTRGKLFD
jgi:hypothetical protein